MNGPQYISPDIVQRLREARSLPFREKFRGLFIQAADEIERLRTGVAQPPTSPVTGALVDKWRSEAKRHREAEAEAAGNGDEEAFLHGVEADRLEKCAAELAGVAQQPAVDVRKLLGAFYKTVDVMKSARNSESKTMNVWADDMKAIEDVMLFLETLRDAGPAQAQRPLPQDVARLIDGEAFQDAHDALPDSWWSYRRDIALRKADAIISSWDDLCSMSSTPHSPSAATIGDIPSEPRPPASAAMGLSAGGDPARCEICDWPLAESWEKGCVPGNCSYRPDDPAEQARIRERRQVASSKVHCEHRKTTDGPRVDLRWGTGPTEVCDDCGMWRTTHHKPGVWQNGPVPSKLHSGDGS